MSLKQGLNEDEFQKLVEVLSRRKEKREGIITNDAVRDSLSELGLSELLVENDIEEVRKQVNRELKQQQRKNYFIFGLILVLLTTPLAAYGGYKLKEFLIAIFPQPSEESEVSSSEQLVNLQEQIKELEADKAELEERLENSEGEKDQLEEKIEELADASSSPKTKPSSDEQTTTTTNSVEHQGLVFDLQECQKSSTSPTTQNITCSLFLTSTQENARVYLYSDATSSRKSRIIEAGKENIATRVQLGSYSGNRHADNNLIKDIPMEGMITFENVPQEIEEIGVLQISSYLESSYYRDDIQIEFHNINLSDA